MFECCTLESKRCSFGARSNGIIFCGLQNGENKIKQMKLCPQRVLYDMKKRREKQYSAKPNRKTKMKHYSHNPEKMELNLTT